MFIDPKTEITTFNRRNYVIWTILAFQSGLINTGGFLAAHRFVTHTTGFATMLGNEFSLGKFKDALGMATVPAFFLLGSMISAILVDRRKMLGRNPNYSFVFLFISILMVFVVLGGYAGQFGDFGAPFEISNAYVLLVCLSMASGLQNAVITTASGAVVRTTHLTGVTTDLGIGLVRIFGGKYNDPIKRERETRSNWLRIATISSFVLGSVIAAFVFHATLYLGFFAPAFLSFGLFAYIRTQTPSH